MAEDWLSDGFSPEEQRYFDTRGAEAPPEAAPDPAAAGAQPDPAAAPAAQPDPAAGAGGEQPAGEAAAAAAKPEPVKPPDGFVPIGALHEARAEARELRDQQKKLEGRFEEIAKAVRQPAAADAAPAPEERDPVDRIADLEKARGADEEATKAAAAFHSFAGKVQGIEAEFARTHADYTAATKYLFAFRDADLAELGHEDPGERARMVRLEAMNLAATAMQQGKNPAEVAYNLAKRWGYKPAANDPAAAKPKTAAEEKLAAAAAGAAASSTLSGAGASGDAGALSIERVAAMSDDEFSSITPAQWRRLMGG